MIHASFPIRLNAKGICLLLVIFVHCCFFQGKGLAASKRDKKSTPTATASTVGTKSGGKDANPMVTITKKCKVYPGLFTFYQDTLTGAVYLMVKNEQFNKEFIYFRQVNDGVAEIAQIRGMYMGSDVITIRKYFNKIEFITKNTAFYFDDKSPLHKASNANISDAIILSQLVTAEDTAKGLFLVKADELFLPEVLQQIKPVARPGTMQYALGSLNKDKTKFLSIKSYPKNADVVVEYVYDNPAQLSRGTSALADDRYVSIKLQHSWIEMPVNNYQPRFDDPRVGYFLRAMDDMTSTSVTPYHDMITRWHLEKKDKGAALSEPVQPIVWWIENTTPYLYRETVRKAALTWNVAFEKAGFKNAIQVNIQPDTATWDAGDIRYNVLRWTSSPLPMFGGYGPSFTNPRTGQILGADIMIEFSMLSNYQKLEKLIHTSALESCDLPSYLQENCQFGAQALKLEQMPDSTVSELMQSVIYFLVLHELGHTFGLNHNMKASQLYSPSEINNKALTSKSGMMGSVMDYPAINIAKDKSAQGQFMTTMPGPYDLWAIEYGYSEALPDAKEEKKRLDQLLSRSSEPALAFGNDADDMRSPGRGIDPRVNVNDLTNDAIGYSGDRMQVISGLVSKLLDRYTESNKSYQALRTFYSMAMNQYFGASTVVACYIGGVYVDRSFVGQPGATKPFIAVPLKEQKRAMETLRKFVFGTGAFHYDKDLYQHLQAQRRGFGFGYGSNEDPKIHDIVLNIQKAALDRILNPQVLKRITDSKLYGNDYSLQEVLNDLTDAMFKDDLSTSVSTFRQNLQVEYVNRLIEIFKTDPHLSGYDHVTLGVTFGQLVKIQRQLQIPAGVNADAETKTHRQFLAYKIDKTLNSKN